MENQLGVYEIKFPNGEFYIGSSYGKHGIEGRWNEHKRGSRDSPKYLQEQASLCGGWKDEWFKILKIVKNKHRALLWEQAHIHKFWPLNNKNKFLLNRKRDITIIINFPNLSGENNPMFGKKQSDETKRKISEANTGKIRTEEQKNKLKENAPKNTTHAAKITENDVREIRKLYIENFTIENILKNFNITRATLQRIINYVSWRHIDPEQKDSYLILVAEKRKQNKIGSNNPFFNKKHSEETKKNIKEKSKLIVKKCTKSKLTEIQKQEIKEKYNSGNFTLRQLAIEYDVCKNAIHYIVNRNK